jgi:hypothetical protein
MRRLVSAHPFDTSQWTSEKFRPDTKCAHRFKDMTESLSGRPAGITVEDYPIGEENDPDSSKRLVSIVVGDQVIETTCSASSCTASDPGSIEWQAEQNTKPSSNPSKSSAMVASPRVMDVIIFAAGLFTVGYCLQ